METYRCLLSTVSFVSVPQCPSTFKAEFSIVRSLLVPDSDFLDFVSEDDLDPQPLAALLISLLGTRTGNLACVAFISASVATEVCTSKSGS